MPTRSSVLRQSAVLLAGIGLILGISACGSPSATPTTTSTTSTTLPNPLEVLATQPSGSAAFEGPVERVSVPLLANGSSTLPVRPAGERVVTGVIKIAYRQFGSGPNLVMAMGEHGSMTWWDPNFLNALAQNWRVTIFDAPGIGYSATTIRPPSIETDGDLMAGLIASLGLSNVTVLGWGMGGEATLSMIERHRKIAIGLVLVDSTAGGPKATRPDHLNSSVFGSPTSTVSQLATVMYPETAAGIFSRSAWLADIATVEPDDVLFGAITGEAAAQNIFFRNDHVAKGLSAIAIPTWIFTGFEDGIIPERNSELLHLAIRGSTLTIDRHAGYTALFQDSSAFMSGLSTFMSRSSAVTTTTGS